MESYDALATTWLQFAKQCLQLEQWASPGVHSLLFRHDNFSLEIRGRPREDRQLDPNAKVFENAENLTKRGLEDPKDNIGNQMRGTHALRRELKAAQAEEKETLDMLEGQNNFGQHDFRNWTPPSVPQGTARGLKTLIRHSRRKVTAMRKLLARAPEVSEGNKSKNEKLDEGRKGGEDSKVIEAKQDRCLCWLLQCLSDGEGEPPREEILKEVGTTKERWSRMIRVLRDDEPRDDDLKWLGWSKEDVIEFKKALVYMNAFGVDAQAKMRKYWNAFRNGFKGRDVSEMG